EEDGSLLLEVRTRDAGLDRGLAAYSLRGPAGQVEGFIPLAPDVEGWFAGQSWLDAAALHAALGGRCVEALASPAPLDLLGSADCEALVASAAAARGRPGAAAWQAWLEGAAAGAAGAAR